VTTGHDAIIVGAGPAGIAAAVELTARGLDVVVVDKATFPRDKTCGDGLTTLALRELDRLRFDPATVASWTKIERAHLHSPAGRTVTLPLPHGPGLFAAVARRIELDAALVELAAARGVPVHQGHALTAATMRHDHIEVVTSTGDTMRARWVIGADGVWSPLRKALRLDEHGYRGEWHAFRQYVTGVSHGPADLHVWFERDILPGYVWSFPLPHGAANVGFGVLRGARLDGKALARLWPALLERPPIRAVLGPDVRAESPHRAWPIPARITRTRLAAGRALFVGDAARATDVFTGEGIGQALLTGRLAAEAIADAADDATASPGRWRGLHPPRSATSSRPTTAWPPRCRRWCRRRRSPRRPSPLVGANDWTRRNVGRWLFEDSPRGIALTPRRWHRGALSGPAAFTAGTQT
jgi:menaquinone-9 beta-reductase